MYTVCARVCIYIYIYIYIYICVNSIFANVCNVTRACVIFVPTSAAIVAAEWRGMAARRQSSAVYVPQYRGFARPVCYVTKFSHGLRKCYKVTVVRAVIGTFVSTRV